APRYHGLQDALRSLHRHSRTKGTACVCINSLACFSSHKDHPCNGRLDQHSAKPSCLPYQWHAQHLGPPIIASAPTSPPTKNVSVEAGAEEEPTSPASQSAGTETVPSSTSGGLHLTPTPEEHSPVTPEASVPATGSQPQAESPALTSPQAPTSSPSPPSTSPLEVPSASISTSNSSTETSTKPTGAPTTPKSPEEEHSSGQTPTSHATATPMPTETTSQAAVPPKGTPMLIDTETTAASPRVIMQEVEHALSSGSIAAITVTVIAVVLLVFGVAAYLKIRHSSYGRLLDDHDYGSWGNYNNPLYDDS
uniref:Prostate androgen-regulated mucin-like protein 1 n=1 Tax=Sus scrofa TaxID=9823 RepID=A0A4X1T3V6_PIG